MLFTRKKPTKYLCRRKSQRLHTKVSYNQSFSLCVLVLCLLSVYHIWTMNANATQGFVLRDLDNSKKQLTLEKNMLTVQIAEQESIQSLVDAKIGREMIQVRNPEYIAVNDTDALVLVTR